MQVPFGQKAATLGATALAVLAIGQVFFSLFTIGGTILNGAGKTVAATLIAAATLGLAALASLVMVPRASLELEPRYALVAAAGAQSVAVLVGFMLMGIWIHRSFRAFIPLASAARVTVGTIAAWFVGRALPAPTGSKLVVTAWAIAECLLVMGVFLAVLMLLRELGREDGAKIMKVFRRR